MPYYLFCSDNGSVVGAITCPEHDVHNQEVTGATTFVKVNNPNNIPDLNRNDVTVDLTTGQVISSVAKQLSADTAVVISLIRKQRDKLLASSDWTQVSDAPVDQSAWATYRQALRDIPQPEGFPENIVWPTKPQ